MDTISNGINEVNGVKNTFSSWDSCMSKTYCKWPVIVGIIIGALIIISILTCIGRCLCCGLECCCGCCRCCNACCPSPRGGKNSNQGYQQAPPTPYQYHPPPPMYPGGQNTGYYGAARNVPQTATFESASKSAKYNEDALPAMPSWDTATKRRVEEPPEENDVEMDKLQPSHAQQEVGLLTGSAKNGQDRYDYSAREEAGDLGAHGMHPQGHATPYQDYASSPQQQRFGGASPYAAQGHQQTTAPYSPNGSQHNPYSSVISPVAAPYGSSTEYFAGDNRQPQQHYQQSYAGGGYEPSIAAPSYRTHDVVSPVSPPGHQQQYQAFGPAGRNPTQQYGQQPNWREI